MAFWSRGEGTLAPFTACPDLCPRPGLATRTGRRAAPPGVSRLTEALVGQSSGHAVLCPADKVFMASPLV